LHQKKTLNPKDLLKKIAKTIYYEGKDEGVVEMKSIGNIIRNRYKKNLPIFGNQDYGMICELAFESAKKPEPIPQTKQELEAYRIALEVAKQIMTDKLTDFTSGALYYEKNKFYSDEINRFENEGGKISTRL